MTMMKHRPWMPIVAALAVVAAVTALVAFLRRRDVNDPAEEMARSGRRGSPAPASEVVTV